MDKHCITVPAHRVIRARFIERGSTLAHWARAQAYSVQYVYDLTLRYGERAASPRGKTARRILRDLEKALSAMDAAE